MCCAKKVGVLCVLCGVYMSVLFGASGSQIGDKPVNLERESFDVLIFSLQAENYSLLGFFFNVMNNMVKVIKSIHCSYHFLSLS